jgi:hypothetical protein
VKLIPSSGFQIVEPDYATGELRYTTIVAFETSDDEARWVSPITEPIVGDYAPPHPDRLIRRLDGLLVTQDGRVGTEDAALAHFRDQPHRRQRIRRQRWSQTLLTAPIGIDQDGRPYFDTE